MQHASLFLSSFADEKHQFNHVTIDAFEFLSLSSITYPPYILYNFHRVLLKFCEFIALNSLIASSLIYGTLFEYSMVEELRYE